MRRLTLATLLAALLPAAGAAAQTPAGCDPSLPVVAHHPAGSAVQLPAGAALPVACTSRTGYPTSVLHDCPSSPEL